MKFLGLVISITTLVTAGCFDPKLPAQPFLCGDNGVCPPDYSCDLETSLCVSSSGLGGDGGVTPDADCQATSSCGSCEPNSVKCAGDSLEVCGADGRVTSQTACPVGCDTSITPNACWVLSPSNLPEQICDQPGTASRRVTGTLRVDTNNCGAAASGLAGTVISQGNNLPELCLFKLAEVTVMPGASVIVTGDRLPVFVATGSMTIAGSIDVAGHGITGGPGAGTAQLKGRGGFPGFDTGDGGGGGGYATTGGGGTGHGSSGEAFGSATGIPLEPGGFGGGGSAHCTQSCPVFRGGGGGGGALQLVSCGDLSLAGATINAGGGGGRGGAGSLPGVGVRPGGGDGGGAGGTILIEAASVSFDDATAIAANGGGGGGGGSFGEVVNAAGMAGSDGTVSPVAASGGAPGSQLAGGGGSGGTSDGQRGDFPGDGGSSQQTGAGGGGGAGGRIRVNARGDQQISIPAGAVVSPFGAATTGAISRHH